MNFSTISMVARETVFDEVLLKIVNLKFLLGAVDTSIGNLHLDFMYLSGG
jgi:hypothetical protein